MALLRRCERERLGEPCDCRVYSGDLADDLVAAGAVEQAEYLTDRLEPEDVAALADEMAAIDLDRIEDSDLRHRLENGRVQLARLAQHEAGLTDRYSDDLD